MNSSVPVTEIAPLQVLTPAPQRQRTRVLHVIHSVCHGGIESVLINWVRYMDRSKFDIYVASLTGDRNLDASFRKAARLYGIDPVLEIPWNRRKPFLKAAARIADLVRELDIQIVHTHAYYGDVLGALVKRYARVKSVATVYVWEKYELHRQIMQAMDWVALHFVDKVTAHCEETRRRTVRAGFREKNVDLLIAGFPNEVSPPPSLERARLRHEAGIGEGEILLVNVARISPEKAHDQLIRSFRLVHDRHPNTRLWISGTGFGTLQDDLISLRDSLGLTDCLDFVGYQPNLWPTLHSADIMVHSSHGEGVPIALLYGMSAALPIVVSDVGGVYEVIRQDDTGVRVPENDINGFATAICSLVEQPERRARLGAAARRFVTTEYSIQTACERVGDLYLEVLSQ
jgi:glycosyltransferase involved in cell wall biosynthesis